MENTRELFQIFVRRFGLLNASCCDCCCDEEISLVQSHILYEIKRRSQPSMQQVADELGIDITTFSRQIKTLITKGLVTKTPDPEDKRINNLQLTEKGLQVESNIDERMKTVIKKILSQLNDSDQDMVIHSIQLINKAILKSGSCCLP